MTLAMAFLAPLAAQAASIGCLEADSHFPKTICSDPVLVKLDAQVTAAYLKDLAEIPSDKQAIFQGNQKAWLGYRDAFGSDGSNPEVFLRLEYRRRLAALKNPYSPGFVRENTTYICPLDKKLSVRAINWVSLPSRDPQLETNQEAVISLPEWGGSRPVRRDEERQSNWSWSTSLDVGGVGDAHYDENKPDWHPDPLAPELWGDDQELLITEAGPYFKTTIFDPFRSDDNGYLGTVFLRIVNNGVVVVCATSDAIISDHRQID